MSRRGATWWGADPGGRGGFGVAILDPQRCVRTEVVDCVLEAVEFFVEHGGTSAAGLGVDCPLWWSAGLAGSRKADEVLRRRHRLTGGEVQTVNSLRGAAVAQGILLVSLLRKHNPKLKVTESHPKALLNACGKTDAEFFRKHHIDVVPGSQHERDAIVGAIAAREGFSGRWRWDLSTDRHSEEQDPRRHWIGPVHYFWPKGETCSS